MSPRLLSTCVLERVSPTYREFVQPWLKRQALEYLAPLPAHAHEGGEDEGVFGHRASSQMTAQRAQHDGRGHIPRACEKCAHLLLEISGARGFWQCQ
jgi:hypothetical protein